MTKFVKNFVLGKKIFPNNIFYAPICGYSDISFRQLCQKYRPGLFFCEMVKIEGLLRKTPTTYKLLSYEKNMHPIGAQICGSNSKRAQEASRIIEDLGFDLIDLNCGCPVNKVVKDGSGSGMLKTPQLIGEVIKAIVDVVNIPVTVKIRSGWDEKNINAEIITKIAEEAGAAAICIHGRTRVQGYTGKADWSVIKECKKVAKNIKVFANGDLFDPFAVKQCLDETLCDGVFIARGMIGQPWFVESVEKMYENQDFTRSTEKIKEDLLEHLQYILKYEDEKKALINMKKIFPWYLKGLIGLKELKISVAKSQNSIELLDLIKSFDWLTIENKEPKLII
jgi:tRNA-dihydrouridine synthase B